MEQSIQQLFSPTFDTTDIALLITSSLVAAYTIFVCVYYYRAIIKHSQTTENQPPPSDNPQGVSVVMVARDAANYLEKNLPAILSQQYPSFEVIVINNASTDHTDEVLKQLQQQHTHLHTSYLPENNDRRMGRKKLALTLGVKAARYNTILFTEPDACPNTPHWISLMSAKMTHNIAVVAGSHSVQSPKKWLTFCNLIASVQSLGAIIRKAPFTASLYNTAIRKEIFFQHKGFASVLNFRHGEILFFNRIMTGKNSTACTDSRAFVTTCSENQSDYLLHKNRYIISLQMKKHLKGTPPLLLFESICHYILIINLIWITTKSILEKNFLLFALSFLLIGGTLIYKTRQINLLSSLLQNKKYSISWLWLLMTSPLINLYFTLQKNDK